MAFTAQANRPMQLADPGIRAALRRKLETIERRRFRRVPLQTKVRGLTSNGVEFIAETVDVCAGGIQLRMTPAPNKGEAMVLYLEEIGRVEGVVARVNGDGCAVALQAPARKRDKIADQLTWLINRERLKLEDERTCERRTALGQLSAISDHGVTFACSVVDMSIFGVALKTAGPRPMLGERMRVGERVGIVVRYFDGGFALDFRSGAKTD
jgi:hypothetical protein